MGAGLAWSTVAGEGHRVVADAQRTNVCLGGSTCRCGAARDVAVRDNRQVAGAAGGGVPHRRDRMERRERLVLLVVRALVVDRLLHPDRPDDRGGLEPGYGD